MFPDIGCKSSRSAMLPSDSEAIVDSGYPANGIFPPAVAPETAREPQKSIPQRRRWCPAPQTL